MFLQVFLCVFQWFFLDLTEAVMIHVSNMSHVFSVIDWCGVVHIVYLKKVYLFDFWLVFQRGVLVLTRCTFKEVYLFTFSLERCTCLAVVDLSFKEWPCFFQGGVLVWLVFDVLLLRQWESITCDLYIYWVILLGFGWL